MTLYQNDYDKISNYYLEAARGNLLDTSVMHKFGNAEDVDTADGLVNIWDGVSSSLAGDKIPTYTYSTVADIDSISSSDDADAVDIEVQGLDTNWKLVTQTVTLTGRTAATLTTPLVRAFRMINRGATDAAGTVYLHTNGAALTLGVPDAGSTVRAIIKDGDNQTQMALYTVSAGYTMFITAGWANLAKKTAAAADIKIRVRESGGVFRVAHTLSLDSAGSSGDHRPYAIPISFPEKTDIEYLTAVSANDVSVSAGFHALLITD